MPLRTSASIPSDLKLNNRVQILEAMKWGGSYTANQISEQTGLSRQTVLKALQSFSDRGLIVSAGKGESTSAGGKRPDLYAFSDKNLLICVDLWQEQLNLTLMSFQFQMLGHTLLKTHIPEKLDELVDLVSEQTDLLIEKCGAEKNRLIAACISTSGIIDYAEQTLRFSPFSPSWGTNVPLTSLLRPCFGENTIILMENVGKLTARTLLQQTELLERRVLGVFTSWGLSGCLMEGGRILNGKDSLIGEFGHMILSPRDEERCGCGSHGCFEKLVSIDRIRRRTRELVPVFPNSCLFEEPSSELSVSKVFEASAQGDSCARLIVDELARLFAVAMRNITLVFDPDVVVIQGDYASADPYFLSRFHEYLMEFQYYPPNGPFELRLDPRPLKELSAQGAYALLMDHIIQTDIE
ncbi:MAG: ROK family transcriptional regulator [Eubacterium sp.]|nr:ROK family transcriptional regulator [Eubacterium sp.]